MNLNMRKLLLVIAMFISTFVYSQGVAINTDGSTANTSAILDVKSTTQGILFPRMTDAQRDAISSPVDGLIIFNSTSGCINYYFSGGWYESCGIDLPCPIIFADDFSTNKGWSLGTYWSRGSATTEPATDNSATSDNNILGGPLNGDYINSISSVNYATSPIIDCSSLTTVELDFYSFSGCEGNTWDHIGVQVYDGITWITIWSNGATPFQESVWTNYNFDVSAYAAGNSNFQVRFYLGTTDSSVRYSGWGIDDVVVSGC